MMEQKLYYTDDSKKSDFKVWMGFPGITSFSLSSIGYLWLFKLLDEIVQVERICSDTENTRFRLSEVSMFGFSFSFDLDFLTIFKMLEKYNIPLKSKDRDDSQPLIFAGGPVLTANPLPYQDFFDFVIVGDGEFANTEVVRISSENQGLEKTQLLKLLAQVEGVYVPGISKSVQKQCVKLSECVYTPILSDDSFFKNTFIVEIARGCSNRCGFCLASYLNLPVRFVDYKKIIEAIDLGLEHTNKIALLGALISAHPNFGDICKYIYDKIQSGQEIEMSVSSLRADAIDPDVVKTLVAAGQKNTTIAIEAGSERLRKVINKNLTENQILNTAKVARKNGLKGLKIYAMIGIPTETKEDLVEIVNLAKKLKAENKGFDLTFAFSSFVPKPHTPFQWCGRDSIKSLEKKQEFLKKEFHKIGIKARFSSVKWDYYQAVLSRGDETFGDYVLAVYQNGANLGAFKSVAKKLKIDTEKYATADYSLDMHLPWDFIEMYPKKEFLKEEYCRLLGLANF